MKVLKFFFHGFLLNLQFINFFSFQDLLEHFLSQVLIFQRLLISLCQNSLFIFLIHLIFIIQILLFIN